jgi:hypothetical protein
MSVLEAAHPRSTRRVVGLGLAVLLTVGLAVSALAPKGSDASSHREAPLVSGDPQVDQTDLYAWRTSNDTVTIVSSWIPFEEPAGGPNFYAFDDDARYDVNISNDGDASPELIYRWTFSDVTRNPNTFLYNTGAVTSLTDTDLNIYQTYDLKLVDKVAKDTTTLVNDAIVVPNNVGAASMPDYQALYDAGTTTFDGTSKSWVGQSDDPFFLDLRVFDLLYGGDFSEVGDDTLAGFNVHSMALQIPIDEVAKGGDAAANPVIGLWNTAARRSTRVQDSSGGQTFEGKWVQVSRLGMPLVNEVVVPVSLKDYFNASKPKDDEQYLAAVQDPEVPKLIEAIYGIPAPATPRDDLVAVFLTGLEGLNQPAGVEPAEMLRLNLTIAPCTSACSTRGVMGGDNAGFPNGRRLSDDVIDITLQAAEGEIIDGDFDDLATLGDGVNENDIPFLATFPYLALPHSGSDTAPH